MHGGSPLLRRRSPENSEGAGPLPVDTAGHESSALCPLYAGSYSIWLLWSFIKVPVVRILGTLPTEQVMFAGFLSLKKVCFGSWTR